MKLPEESTDLLTDKYSAIILTATCKEPKSASELSAKYRIPLAACYRRIHALEKAGLLNRTERKDPKSGKRYSLYGSEIQNICFFFEDGKLIMRGQIPSQDWKDKP